MRFYEFINILRDNSNEKSQERYLACVVSALCGETNPISNNKRHSLSSFLPKSLASIEDSSNRKKVFYENSTGFSKRTKQDIRISVDRKRMDGELTSRDTFIAYLEQSVLKGQFSSLCVAFDVPDSIDKFIVFEGIYEQFMEFVRSINDEADLIIPAIVSKLSEDKTVLPTLATPSQSVLTEENTLPENGDKEVTSHDATPSVQMLKIFKQTFDSCRVDELMREPGLLDPDVPSLVERFIKTIQLGIVPLFDHCKTDPMYIWISQLTNEVNEYNEYLKKNTEPTQGAFGFLVPLHRFEVDSVIWQIAFQETSNYYQQRIKFLYNQIIGSTNE